jgi:hypothetical protein
VSTLKERINDLHIPRGVVAHCAGLTRPQLSDFLNDERLLSGPKTGQLQIAVGRLELFIKHLLPRLNELVAPMRIDLSDATGIANAIKDLPTVDAVKEFVARAEAKSYEPNDALAS